MKLYRIHTEYNENIGDIVSQYFDGFTLVSAMGYYKGEKEHSIIIEIMGEDNIHSLVSDVSEIIRWSNKQKEVLFYAIQL